MKKSCIRLRIFLQKGFQPIVSWWTNAVCTSLQCTYQCTLDRISVSKTGFFVPGSMKIEDTYVPMSYLDK